MALTLVQRRCNRSEPDSGLNTDIYAGLNLNHPVTLHNKHVVQARSTDPQLIFYHPTSNSVKEAIKKPDTSAQMHASVP